MALAHYLLPSIGCRKCGVERNFHAWLINTGKGKEIAACWNKEEGEDYIYNGVETSVLHILLAYA